MGFVVVWWERRKWICEMSFGMFHGAWGDLDVVERRTLYEFGMKDTRPV